MKTWTNIVLPTFAIAVAVSSLPLGTVAADDKVELVPGDGKVTVKLDGELFTEYIYEGHSKPILYPVLGPGGQPMTRDYPMKEDVDNEARDHPHQKSIWFTHGSINGADFWLEYTSPNAKRQPGQVVQIALKTEGNAIEAENEWYSPDKKLLCKDQRKVSFGTTEAGRYIDYQVTFQATEGDVVFGDTKEGMMGIRTHPRLRLTSDERRGCHTVAGACMNSEGIEGSGIWGKRAKWVCYWAPFEGGTLGIAIFDHPGNLRHPTWWHARTYGLVAANPFGIHDFEKKPAGTGDYTLEAGKSMTFRYRFLFHKGDAKEADIAGEYAKFAEQ
jgi:hypothetical protein